MTIPAKWEFGERDTVIAALDRAVAAHPDRVLLDFGGEMYSYGAVDRLSNRLAHALAGLGVAKGETVLTMLDNNVDAVVTWLAVNKLRAIWVPINTALKGEFLRHQIADADAAIVIAEADYVPRIAEVQPLLPAMTHLLHRDAIDRVSREGVVIAPLDDHRGDNDAPLIDKPDPAELALLIYTSGTTGPSKGCMIPYNYMCNLARLQLRSGPAGPNDITFTPLPLFHMNAVVVGVVATILTGSRVAIAPRFSLSNFWPEIERSGATIASILGGMGALVANAEDSDAALKCRGQIHTVRGNPFTEEVKAIWRDRFGARQVGGNGYGLTEAAVVTSLPAGDYAAPGSSGKRVPDFDVRIVDDRGVEVPPGVAGEIIIRPNRPDIMFKGYWRRPEETLRIMDDLWLHSGDIGKFDEDGFFYFVDRKKDYLRRRGENISSFEMEAAFHQHPEIEEVAVHAVFSPRGEDDVKVTAVLKPGAALAEEALFRWAIDKVPYYALPRYIEFRETLPKNPQGRVLKYQLRDEGRTPATWDFEETDIQISKK
ncbi:MAG: AMP-binding protein [Allosphingosinicella sp.]|uniref:AMP-binding protein n=1 Tax=Allosphingosinicella sp. TaxID=2823234 RepID=UPI003952D33B